MSLDDLHLITAWAQVVRLRDEGLLTPAEIALIDAAKTGDTAQIGLTVPNLKSPQVTIRATLLRYLILGGCSDFRTQPSGVSVSGAWIAGTLALGFTTARGPVNLTQCHFADCPDLTQLRVDGLAVTGSTLAKGLEAARIAVAGNLALNGTLSEGRITLSGCDIGGHLTCTQATLRVPDGAALKAQGGRFAGGVLLEGATIEGQVSLIGARIGGQLVLIGTAMRNPEGHALNAQSMVLQGDAFFRHAETEGEVSLMGAEINGVLDCVNASFRNPDGDAFNAQRLSVREGFVWRKIAAIAGAVDLTSAHVGDLWDDPESWAKCDRLYLSGFRYDVLHGAINIPDRLAWLEKGAVSRREFYPQPYAHLARLLRETGHRNDAQTIMVAKERAQRRASRARWSREVTWRDSLLAASQRPTEERAEAYAPLLARRPADPALSRLMLLFPAAGDAALPDQARDLAQQDFRQEQRRFRLQVALRNAGSLLIDRIFGLVVGYGHKPERSFYVLVVLVLIGWLAADRTWDSGDFAPAQGPVLMSEGWQVLARDPAVSNPALVWSDKYLADGTLSPGRDYETFHPLAYAVDVVVPLISLGQEASWAPSTTRGLWGKTLWWVRWWLISLGWVVTAIGAAAVTGVIRRD